MIFCDFFIFVCDFFVNSREVYEKNQVICPSGASMFEQKRRNVSSLNSASILLDIAETISTKNQPGVEQLTHSSISRICSSSSTALCVIAFLAQDDDDDDIRKKEEIMDKVRTSATLRVS